MNITTEQLVETVKEAFKDKKAKNITTVDMRGIEEAMCDYFVICEGNTPTQVAAIYDRVEEMVREKLREKPVKIAGAENCLWVAMDYVDVMVHIFLPEARQHYDIEHLWEDAELTKIPDID